MTFCPTRPQCLVPGYGHASLYSPYGEYSKAFPPFFSSPDGRGRVYQGTPCMVTNQRDRGTFVSPSWLCVQRIAGIRGSPSGGGCASIPHERASGGLEGGRRPVPQGLRRIAAPGRASRFLSQLRQKCPIGTSGQAQKKGLCAPRDRSFHGDKESLARLKAVPTPYPLKTRPCSPLRLR